MWTFLGILLAVTALVAIFLLALPHLLFHYVFARPSRSSKVPKAYQKTKRYQVSKAGVDKMKSGIQKDVYLTSRDGLRLHAYFYPTEEAQPKKFILGIHGFKSYSRAEFGPYYDFYKKLGYSCLLPDDRAHGPSEGSYIGFGVLDRLDCIDWAKYLVKTYGEDIEIFLHGVSMGSATVIAASGEADLPKQVKGILADCGYTSAYEELSYQFEHKFRMPVGNIMDACERICKKRAGFDFHTYTPLDQVKKATVPMLFIHGDKDKMVPPYMATELYNACGSEKKKLLLVKDASHAASVVIQPDNYFRTVKEFFNL